MAILIIISIREVQLHKKELVDMIGENKPLVENQAQAANLIITVDMVIPDMVILDLVMAILAIPDMDIQGIQVMVILVKNHFLEKTCVKFSKIKLNYGFWYCSIKWVSQK